MCHHYSIGAQVVTKHGVAHLSANGEVVSCSPPPYFPSRDFW